jgi:hypothetical protein
MSLLPLPTQTLAWLKHAADSGQCEPLALLHLIARADARDQDVAVFVDSYSKTIAALCRRLEALERGAGLRHPVEDAEAAGSDSVADTAQRITDYAAKAGLTVQDWARAFSAAPVPRQAPVPGEVGELVEWLNQVAQYLVDNGVTGAPHVQGAAILLEQQEAELAALRGVPVAELDDQRREAVHQAVAEALGTGAYDCHRVWEAWGVGTMGPDDFVPVAEDSDRVAEIADAAIDAIRAIPLPAPQAGEVEA